MDNFIKKLNKLEEGFVAFSLLGIAIIAFINTALRYTISYTFTWFQEFANYTMIFMTFLGASIGVKYGTHFSMEALPQYAPDRICHLLKFFAYLISGIITCLFIYYGFVHILKVKSFGVTSAAMQIPMYIPYLPIPIFSLVMSFRFLFLSFKHLVAFFKGAPFERVKRKE